MDEREHERIVARLIALFSTDDMATAAIHAIIVKTLEFVRGELSGKMDLIEAQDANGDPVILCQFPDGFTVSVELHCGFTEVVDPGAN